MVQVQEAPGAELKACEENGNGNGNGKAIEVVTAPQELCLDLGCGQATREGYQGVDLTPGPLVRHVVNLFKFPWPWGANTVAKLSSSHLIEHIPDCYVGKDGTYKLVPDSHDDQDMLFAFFDECYRILKPEGKFELWCPSSTSDRAFQDPTHRRFIAPNTWLYFTDSWRKANKLDHYNVKCRFGVEVDAVGEFTADGRNPEYQQRAMKHYRNYVNDWHVTLTAKKG